MSIEAGKKLDILTAHGDNLRKKFEVNPLKKQMQKVLSPHTVFAESKILKSENVCHSGTLSAKKSSCFLQIV